MDYLRALRRSYLLVIVCVIACIVGAGIAVVTATPKYTATASLIVSGSSAVGAIDEISQRELAAARATAFAQIASTQPAVSDAVSKAGYPAGTALPAVTGSAPTMEPFLTISVTSTDKVFAAKVANAFVNSLGATTKRLDQVPSATPIVLSVLTPAGIPSSPTSPKKKQDLGLGLVLGLILGVAVALLREVTDRTVRDSDAAGAAIEVTVLGVVPYEAPKELLIAASQPRGIRTEAYRQVRTALISANQDVEAEPLHRLIITSATAGEGKSSLAANLAKIYARAGQSVVVVDADLRRPRIATYYGLPKDSRGLSDVLAGTATLAEVTNLQDDGRLGIVPSGAIPANPSEALGAQGMQTVLDELSNSWDVVLIDTPPVLPVADALVLAPKVDGVILVTRLGETTVDKLRRARAAIDKVGGRIVGLVPNGATAGDDSAYRYVYGRKNRYTGSYIDVVPADAETLPTEAAPVITPSPPKASPPSSRGDADADAASRPAARPTTGRSPSKTAGPAAAKPADKSRPAGSEASSALDAVRRRVGIRTPRPSDS